MIQFHTTDRPKPLNTRETLTEFLAQPVVKPDLLTSAKYKALSAAAKQEYDRRRTLYLSGGIVLQTPYLAEAKKLLVQCFAENSGRNSGHAGLMLSGDSTLGKTTITKALMRFVFGQFASQFPDFVEHNRVPVVYITVPAGSTGKLLMKSFAKFFGMTVRNGESMGNIQSRVTDVISEAGTQLIVVDELHNLAGRSFGKGESTDLLKNLHNDLAATFVYAGIDLGEGTLLSGARGKQLAGRFSMLDMTRFNLSNQGDRKVWRGLIAAFEAELLLHDHEPGTLLALFEYLYERTDGSIGSLGRLLTGSAIETINNSGIGREVVDQKLMDTRKLDLAAENAYRRRQARSTKKASGVELVTERLAS